MDSFSDFEERRNGMEDVKYHAILWTHSRISSADNLCLVCPYRKRRRADEIRTEKRSDGFMKSMCSLLVRMSQDDT